MTMNSLKMYFLRQLEKLQRIPLRILLHLLAAFFGDRDQDVSVHRSLLLVHFCNQLAPIAQLILDVFSLETVGNFLGS